MIYYCLNKVVLFDSKNKFIDLLMQLFKSSVNKMPPAKEDQVNYERRAQRMIERWAGVRGPVRSDEERNNVTEIFTDRLQLSESREESFVLGTLQRQ